MTSHGFILERRKEEGGWRGRRIEREGGGRKERGKGGKGGWEEEEGNVICI